MIDLTDNGAENFFFFSSRRRHPSWPRDWSSDVCSSDLGGPSLIHDQTTVFDEDGDGYLEPGETFELDERIRNTGGQAATNVSSVLSTGTSGVTITQANSGYPDIPAG